MADDVFSDKKSTARLKGNADSGQHLADPPCSIPNRQLTKKTGRTGFFIFGAADRNRTGTEVALRNISSLSHPPEVQSSCMFDSLNVTH